MKHETSLFQDLSRGLVCRCPHCGEGKLFSKWLKVTDRCDICGEEFHHHRADDFPAYVVILLLGHIMVPFAFWMEDTFTPPMWVNMAVTIPLTIGLCLLMLQPVKGAIVALQWRMGMHGFKDSRKEKTAD
jgi:uncharacterized protein (DUF983 family)